MTLTKNICILAIAATILFSCNLPEQSSVAQSSSESLKSVKTRAADDFLWDIGTSDRQIYTGFSQLGSRWICGRISRKDGNLWWFNEEGDSQENLINKLYDREQNYKGLILKKLERDIYVFNEQEYPDISETVANYYKGLKFVYRGNGELEWHNNDQLIAVFKKAI